MSLFYRTIYSLQQLTTFPTNKSFSQSGAPTGTDAFVDSVIRQGYFVRNTSGKMYFPSAALRVVIKIILFEVSSGSGATAQTSRLSAF